MGIRISKRFFLIAVAALAAAAVSSAAAQTADRPQQQIRALLSGMFDQPGRKVDAAPIAVVGGYAIADWVQGDQGGRALLRRTAKGWEIMACGGDGIKDMQALRDAGISKGTAGNLLGQLTAAERSVDPARLKRFSLFNASQAGPVDHHPLGSAD